MKFSTALSISALITAASAAAAAAPANIFFTPLATSEDGKFKDARIKKVDDHPHVFLVGGDEGTDVSLILNGESNTLVDQDNKGIYVNPDTGDFGDVDPFGSQDPSSSFTIFGDNGLALNGNSNWKACPSGDNKYSLALNDCEGGTAIVVNYANNHYVYD